jgi:hypothetical protein
MAQFELQASECVIVWEREDGLMVEAEGSQLIRQTAATTATVFSN